LINQLSEHPATTANLLGSIVPFVVGLLLLSVPMRRANDFRGLHEMLSGTCVMRLPRAVRALRLVASSASPLESLPARQDPIPRSIAGYPVRAGTATDGGYILLGEDSILGRRILILLRPEKSVLPQSTRRHAVIRPTRLRFLHSGSTTVGNKDLHWEVFVAPSGHPLPEIALAQQRLSWRETRPILQQLAEELAATTDDATMPGTLCVEQVWVQPDGRVQLLDSCIGPRREKNETDALGLLRAAAVLALEGRCREVSPGSDVAAPIPKHAARHLRRLSGGPRGVASPAAFRDELSTTQELPTDVTPAMRIGHCGMQLIMLAPGLLTMFVVSGLFALFRVAGPFDSARNTEQLLAALDSPTERARLAALPEMKPFLADRRLTQHLHEQLEIDRAAGNEQVPNLTTVERILLHQVQARPPDRGEAVDHRLIDAARKATAAGQPDDDHQLGRWPVAVGVILIWPVAWALGAFVLRPGVSLPAVGLALVRRDGRRPTRWQCALRSLLVWVPVAGLLAVSVFVQAQVPSLTGLRTLLWLAALVLAVGYVFAAVAAPERAIHDRWLGLQLVPR
jgi:hypothetical protein